MSLYFPDDCLDQTHALQIYYYLNLFHVVSIDPTGAIDTGTIHIILATSTILSYTTPKSVLDYTIQNVYTSVTGVHRKKLNQERPH